VALGLLIWRLPDLRDRRPPGEITSLAHALFPGGADHVLVIGPGGGRDVVHALSSGAHHVTGVEINPLILTDDGRVHALDAKVTLDSNPTRARFRPASACMSLRRSYE